MTCRRRRPAPDSFEMQTSCALGLGGEEGGKERGAEGGDDRKSADNFSLPPSPLPVPLLASCFRARLIDLYTTNIVCGLVTAVMSSLDRGGGGRKTRSTTDRLMTDKTTFFFLDFFFFFSCVPFPRVIFASLQFLFFGLFFQHFFTCSSCCFRLCPRRQGGIFRCSSARLPPLPRGLPRRDNEVDVSPCSRQRHHRGCANPVHLRAGLHLQSPWGQPASVCEVRAALLFFWCIWHDFVVYLVYVT